MNTVEGRNSSSLRKSGTAATSCSNNHNNHTNHTHQSMSTVSTSGTTNLSTGTAANGNSHHHHTNNSGNKPLKCVCNWERCRNYSNILCQDNHSVLAGPPLKIKLDASQPEQVALKESIDKLLGINQSDWKLNSSTGVEYVRYTIARHHYTERHVQKYLDALEAQQQQSPQQHQQSSSESSSLQLDKPGAKDNAAVADFSLCTTFTKHGARKYLASVDANETWKNDQGEVLYLPVPNVPKEKLDSLCRALKKKLKTNGDYNSNGNAKSNHNREDPRENVAKSRQTEQENVVLRDQIDNMKSQLAYLQDMVMKLQEEHYVGSGASVAGGGSSTRGARSTNRNANVANRNGPNNSSNNASQRVTRRTYSARSQSVRSGRSGVPHEIELGDSDDETDINTQCWNETVVADGEEDEDDQQNDDWTEYGDDDVDPSDTSGTYQGSTYQGSTYRTPRRRHSGSGMSVGSCVSTKSRAKSVISTTKSIKSLPREIELDEDEEDSDDHESLEEEAFDNRSYASSKFSHGGVSLEDYHGSSRRAGSRRNAHSAHRRNGEGSVSGRGVTRRGSNGTSVSGSRHSYSRNSRRGSSVRSSNRTSAAGNPAMSGGSAADDNASVASTRSGKSVTFDASSQNGSGHGSSSHGAGTYQVASLVVTDPYGEKGTYTGSISHSTGMPHGSGRLEYDKAGRWYEGDWKHGRWTGYGRLSNGDGDFYEGGLKNDHKHGRGVMRFADGRTFVGEYVNGQMIEGKMTYQDGSTYAGSWVDGMRHGRGRCVFSDQSVYEGEFREGEFFGYGRMAWSDGGWYEGEWFNGEMHGRGKEVRPDGTLRHEGDWSKGQPIRH